MKRVLLLDCYLDPPGAEATFAPLVSGCQLRSVRVPDGALVDVSLDGTDAIIISGSAASCVEPPPWAARIEHFIRSAVSRQLPVLGVCFGHQMVARALWGPGAVRPSSTPELGWLPIRRNSTADPLLDGIEHEFDVFCSHVEEVASLPEAAVALAASDDCAIQAYRVVDKPIWGVQFHAEMSVAEATAVVGRKASAHPERDIDAEALCQNAVDATALARRLLDNFVGQIP